MAVTVGDKMPSFSLLDQRGVPVSMEEYIGKVPVVIFFYPKDFTPGCTQQSCDFRDRYEAFEAYGAKIFGISRDGAQSHLQFAEKHQLPFPLLTDKGGKVSKLFGVKGKLMGLIPGRATYVADAQGNLILALEQWQAAGHVSSALRALEMK